MRTGKDLILATRAYAQDNRTLSWYYLLSSLALLGASLVLTQLPIHLGWRIAGSVLAALLTVRVFIIFHDFEHGAILNESRVAEWIMKIYGVLVLAPVSVWKRTHDYHHKHNSKLFSASIGSYPIMTRDRFLSATPRERRIYLAIRHPLTIVFGYLTMFVFGFCIGSFLSSKSRHWDGMLALGIHIAIGIGLYLFNGWTGLLLGQTLPFFIAFAIGSYLFYAQHNFPEVSFQDNADWSYVHAALESSSYMRMPRIMHWFTGNIGYHHIHHLNSRIPFYNLPKVMEAFPELQQPKVTSLSPLGIYRCFQLKVWDAEQKRMIGAKEALRGAA